jgi:hypothetical protein
MRRFSAGFLRCLLGLAVLSLLAGAAEAGDITVFISKARPDEIWADGYGAALGSSWLPFVTFEAEVARVPGEFTDSGMTSFTGSALLSAPLPIIKPYGGLGVGIFRQTRGDERDTGTLRALVLGGKMTFGLAVVRVDYRKLHLSGPPMLEIDHRLSLGVGLSF